MIGVVDQVARAIQQREIDAPRTDADAADLVLAQRLVDADLHVVPQLHRVPLERVRRLDRLIAKTVDFFHRKGATIEADPHHATGLGAEVNREDGLFGHGCDAFSDSANIWRR